MNKLVKGVPETKLYREFLQSLNGILGLTDRELDFLEKLIEIEISTKLPDEDPSVTSTYHRKVVNRDTGITLDNLSRYVKKFRNLGILVNGASEGEEHVNKALIPEIIGDRVQITIILKVKKNEQKDKP